MKELESPTNMNALNLKESQLKRGANILQLVFSLDSPKSEPEPKAYPLPFY